MTQTCNSLSHSGAFLSFNFILVEPDVFYGNPQFPAKSDGVIGEIRKGTRTLARVVVPNGSAEATLEAAEIPVAKGDLLRLVIGYNACTWFDSTRVGVVVKSDCGKQWDLAESVRKPGRLGNDRPTRSREWWLCAGDGLELDFGLFGRSR